MTILREVKEILEMKMYSEVALNSQEMNNNLTH